MFDTPVRSIRNQYRGINAHAHSHWQEEDKEGWREFHNRHIGDVAVYLKRLLLPMGYTATIERSLKVERPDLDLHWPEADVLVTDVLPGRVPTPAVAAPYLALSASAMLFREDEWERGYEWRAVAVRSRTQTNARQGWVVLWLEMLSPTNKRAGRDANRYAKRRLALLHEGLVFVELDYLHEAARRCPAWNRTAHTATWHGTYRIAIIDPRPHLRKGRGAVTGWHVDEPLPTLRLPLLGDDHVDVDFDAPYQRTYEDMLYGLEIVDYRQRPLRFDRYTPDDQARVLNRMVAVLEAARDGRDLEAEAPFPAPELSLDEADARLAALVKNP